MATSALGESEGPKPKKFVNDFTITVATVNGSGSTTSNVTLIRALFGMGIPVSGKNLYPSNIQGMPTWFLIRLNKDGYLARASQSEIVVAMCEESFQEDVALLPPGGVLIYDGDLQQEAPREDIISYALPIRNLVRKAEVPHTLRSYVANMLYVGALVWLLGIDLQEIRRALAHHFSGKDDPVEMNFQMVKTAWEYCDQELEKTGLYHVQRMGKTSGLKLVSGNEAAALGAAFGGIQFAAWYPITPATGLADMLHYHLPRLRKDPDTGRNTFAVVQAEDELAAVGMAVGAGWGGLRAMTSTSGPGLSLMTEFVSLAYFSETPLVIWDVQRVGPSTGLPTRTSQGDILMAHFLGHGDTQNVLLLPGNMQECFQFGGEAFDLAERLQTPVLVMSDLDLGVNLWMTEPFEYPAREMDRGKVLWEEDLEAIDGAWGRYVDVDGDYIPYRTLPGNQHPKSAWFARGTGHDAYAKYSEDPDDWHDNMERLKKKFEQSRKFVPGPIIEMAEVTDIGILAYGSTDPAVQEAREILTARGLPTNYCRVRAVPFTEEVHEFIRTHDRVYVIEMNRDGQLNQLLQLDLPDLAGNLISIARLDGLPFTAAWIVEALQAREGMSA